MPFNKSKWSLRTIRRIFSSAKYSWRILATWTIHARACTVTNASNGNTHMRVVLGCLSTMMSTKTFSGCYQILFRIIIISAIMGMFSIRMDNWSRFVYGFSPTHPHCLDFNSMQILVDQKPCNVPFVRLVTTRSRAQSRSPFATDWKWFWMLAESIWIEYGISM
jgi:hypothetical protein